MPFKNNPRYILPIQNYVSIVNLKNNWTLIHMCLSLFVVQVCTLYVCLSICPSFFSMYLHIFVSICTFSVSVFLCLSFPVSMLLCLSLSVLLRKRPRVAASVLSPCVNSYVCLLHLSAGAFVRFSS
jgi:hypothetical protein